MNKLSQSKVFTTAGITFDIKTEYPITSHTFHPKLLQFQCEKPGYDNISIQHSFMIPEKIGKLKNEDAHSSTLMWTIFKDKDSWIYKKNHALPVSENNIAFLKLADNCRTCKVYSDFLTPKKYSNARFKSMTLFGFDQLLITNLLVGRQGMILHSNSFVHKGKGKLLAGISGSGKTTLTKMLSKKGFHVTSDDRMIVKVDKNKTNMHGSWLHGSTPLFSKGVHHLDTIFFLEQSHKNQIIPIHDTYEKIRSVFQSIVRPHIAADSWHNLLATVENMIKTVNCYRLLFDMSGKVIDMIAEL